MTEKLATLDDYHRAACNARFYAVDGSNQRCSCGLDALLAERAQQASPMATTVLRCLACGRHCSLLEAWQRKLYAGRCVCGVGGFEVVHVAERSL